MTTIQKASLTKAACVRFDKHESPAHVNDGKGWTAEKATEWLVAHDLDASALQFDDGYIRAKQFTPGRSLGGEHLDVGVLVSNAERSRDD